MKVEMRTVRIVAVGILFGLMPSYGALIRGPMLQGATASNIYVLAECSVTNAVTVNFGTTTNYGFSTSTQATNSTTAGTATYVHRIKLTGLQPNTLYHYRLTGQGTNTSDYTFTTLVNPGTPFRFVWEADNRNGPAVHGQIANRILNSHTSPSPPLFQLAGGDLASDNTYANWTNQWLVTDELELEKWIPICYAPGNHDGWVAGSNMQVYDQAPDSTGGNGYYSFDCGDLHVTIGNYQTTYTNGSTQYNWIVQDVQASLKPWKVFGFHAPAYTWGGSGAHTGDSTLQTLSSNYLAPSGVKVFFAGHNHFYQHNLVNGIRHITCGGAGAPLYTVSNTVYTVKGVSSNCYMVVDVNATNLHMVAYDNLGNVLDTVNLFKPPAPTNFVSAAADQRILLNWSPVTGATNYTVRYGTTNGGPYSTLQNVTTTNTLVTGLTNGTAYYFIVTATDTNGPSAISPQVGDSPLTSPSVFLTAPATGAGYIAPVTIGFSASVSANSNTINKVQFTDAGIVRAEATNAPYTGTWSNITAGIHTLKAIALYNDAFAVTSTPSTVTVYADTVGDGIPDLWRQNYFGGTGQTTNSASCATADGDGDGLSNKQEYLTGSDPTNPDDAFRLNIAITNTPFVVWFTARQTTGDYYAGFARHYAVDFCTNLVDKSWSSVPGYENILGANQTVVYTNQFGGSGVFFRGRLWLQPR